MYFQIVPKIQKSVDYVLFVRSPYIGLHKNISAYKFGNIMVTKSMVNAHILELGDHGKGQSPEVPNKEFRKGILF